MESNRLQVLKPLISASGDPVVAFAVPAGVVLAAVVSFFAIKWSTQQNIASAMKTLELSLRSQERISEATLSVRRGVALQDRLFMVKHTACVTLVQANTRFCNVARGKLAGDYSHEYEKFWFDRFRDKRPDGRRWISDLQNIRIECTSGFAAVKTLARHELYKAAANLKRHPPPSLGTHCQAH